MRFHLPKLTLRPANLFWVGFTAVTLRALANKVRALVEKSGMGSLVTVSGVTRENHENG